MINILVVCRDRPERQFEQYGDFRIFYRWYKRRSGMKSIPAQILILESGIDYHSKCIAISKTECYVDRYIYDEDDWATATAAIDVQCNYFVISHYRSGILLSEAVLRNDLVLKAGETFNLSYTLEL